MAEQDRGIELADHLRPEFVIDLPAGAGPGDVFGAVAARLVETGAAADVDAVTRELTAREAIGSTGVGNGIALPHAIVSVPIARPLIALVRARAGIDWQAVDHRPVTLFVVIVATPQQRQTYLRILAEVARVLSQAPARAAALRARSPAAAVRVFTRPPDIGFLARNRRMLILGGAVIGTYVAARLLLPAVRLPDEGIYHQLGLLRFNAEPWLTRQAVTSAVFLGMILGTLLFWRYRVAVAAVSLGALLLLGVMNIEQAVEYMSLPTVLFIMAMMVLVKWLENVGVFRFIVVNVVRRVGSSPATLLIVLMAFSVVLSGFAGEVSGILVTFGLALEIARRTKTPVLPYLLSLVFATNVGSALTLVGNPIGVYIAFAGGLTFETFLRWATPLAAVTGVVVAVTSLLIFRRRLKPAPGARLDPEDFRADAIPTRELRLGLIVFGVVVGLIILHARVEALLHLGEGPLLVAVPLAAVAFVIVAEQERGKMLIERGIDWWTLIFFMFLFANAACLEHTGVTTKLGYLLLQAARQLPVTHWLGSSGLTGSSLILMLWGAGLGSGFIDNMPIVAALVPIVKDLAAVGLPHASILWWALLFGGCFGGNLTLIGSSANLVALSAYEKATGEQVRFGEWLRAGLVVTLVSLAMATVGLLVQIGLAR